MPSVTHDLALTHTAHWLRQACNAKHQDGWTDRQRCFDALDSILSAYRARKGDSEWRQPPINPPSLLKEVAHRTHFAQGSVYLRWSARQSARAIPRWAGPDPDVLPRDAFVAEAKVVSFWPYRAGALAVADKFEMSLAEMAQAYLRALGAWASGNPALAACVPLGPPPCVAEDLRVLAYRRSARPPSASFDTGGAAVKLGSLAHALIAAILDDASLTPLGAFNVIRDETMRLLGDPPERIAVKVTNAVSELADKLLHSTEEERVLTVAQARQLSTELAGLNALLATIGSEREGGPAAHEEVTVQ